jgi:extracellular elastinolytic metalloproteinase
MSREVDLRQTVGAGDRERDEQRLTVLAREVSDRLPGTHTASVAALDPITGNAARVDSSGAPATAGGYTARALEHVRSVAPVLGLTPTQPVEFLADPIVQTTSSGSRTVHLHQQYHGIRVFQAAQAVRFDPQGAVTSTVGSSVTIDDPPAAAPGIRAEDAVLAAARHVAVPAQDELGATDQFGEPFQPAGVDLDGFVPTVTTVLAESAERETVLAAGPFADPITARLAWFLVSPGDLRLGWQVALAMPGHVQRFVVVVDAGTGDILYSHQTVLSAAATGQVFLVNGDVPRQEIDFPRALTDYGIEPPAGLPAEFPDTWLRGQDTAGANTAAHFGDADVPVLGRRVGETLTFDPHPDSDEQRVVNLFALASSAHDFFYLLGFTEAEGNFQFDSLGRGGAGTDPVDARVYPGAVPGTASMLTPADGTSPVLRMGLVTSTGLHTALDATVVFHEFTHGVTNRLVGGGWDTHALDEIQSAGMGEGWGDYFGCLLTGADVVASWVVGRPGGIRGHRYDADYPGDFGELGQGRYTEVHAIGEVWCATLMEATRRLGSNHLAMQLVVDALKLARANPSFLDMRDAILAALSDMRLAGRLSPEQFTEAGEALWGAFARFGMGPNASCVGARLEGIRADFTTPAQDVAAPEQPAEPEPAESGEYPAYMVTVVLDADSVVRGSVVQTDGEAVAGHDAWTGQEGDRWIRYFVEHPAEATSVADGPADVRLEILDVRFGTLVRRATDPPDAPDRLSATMTFALTGADAFRTAAEGATYLAHVVATTEDSTEASVLTASFGRLRPGDLTDEVALEFRAPAPGRYQLLAAVLLVSADVIGVESGPPLRVVP